MKRFEFFDHAGDLGVSVFGRDLADLFQNAALALFEAIADLTKVRGVTERVITLRAKNLEELMVGWLGELLYLYETEGILFKEFNVQWSKENELMAGLLGESLNEDLHPIRREVKAVTYHQIMVKEENGEWRARIIFDL